MDNVRLLCPLFVLLALLAGLRPVRTQDSGQGIEQAVSQEPTTDLSIPPSEEDVGSVAHVTWPDDANNSTSNVTESTGVSSLDGASNVTTESSNVTASSLNVTTAASVVPGSENSTSPASNSSTNTSTAATNSSSNSTGSSDQSANGNNTATHVYTSMGVVVAALFVAVF